MTGTSPHNASSRPIPGLNPKEHSLSRSPGREDAAAPRASWGNRPLKGRLIPSLVALAAAGAAALGLAAPAAHANNYTVQAVSANTTRAEGWSGFAYSGGANFVSVWNVGGLVGQFSQPRGSFSPGEYVRWEFNSSWNNIVSVRADLSTTGLIGGDWNTLVTQQPTGVVLLAEVPSYNHGPQTFNVSPPGNSWKVRVDLSCGGPGACTGNNAEMRMNNIAVVLNDSTNPAVTSATGPIVTNATLSGNADINVSATDTMSGVYQGHILVDGVKRSSVIMNSNGGECAPIAAGYVFAKQVPCASSVTRTLSVNTAALSEGTHSIEVVVEDASGNTTTAFGPVNRTIDNVPPPQNTSLPLITGVMRHGQTLASDTGTWTGTGISFHRQWEFYDAASGTWISIPNAEYATYAVGAPVYGKKLRLRVRATNSEGTTTAYSDPVGPIASPTDPKGDFDNDGIVNENDPDIDGDGAPNERDQDAYDPAKGFVPLDPDGDLDGDGTPNKNDPDDDGDGVPDDGDADPNDPSIGVPPKGPGDVGTPAPGDGENGGGGSAGGGNGSGGGSGSGGGLRVETQNGQGPVATAALAASFEGTKSKTIKVKWGAKRKITGTLLGRDRQPIKGAKLDVHETPQLMGATAIARGQVVTDAKGRFSYQLPAGVSRTIRIAYKSILEASTYAQSTDVTVQVTPKVTMKADRKSLRNKQAVTFKGKIAGAPAGVRKIVEFQALDGKKWRTFASTRVAKKGGTFKYRYRFTRTARTTKYQFRAIVRAEKGWPFVTGQTKALHVKVRP